MNLGRLLKSIPPKTIRLAALAAILLLVGVAMVVSSTHSEAIKVAPWTKTYTGENDKNGTLKSAILTPDAEDTQLARQYPGGRLFVTAPSTNQARSNLRKVYWPAVDKKARNTQACATWVGENSRLNQEGLAARINSTADKTTAVTLTKNVIYDVHWVFNVHTWDSSNTEKPFTQIAQFDMSKAVMNEIGNYQYMPWRVCLRTVDSTVTMKIWFPQLMSEPSWTDKTYTAKASGVIPESHLASGNTGWYAGHVPASGNMQYANLGIWRLLN